MLLLRLRRSYMEPTFASLSLIEQGRQMLMLDKLQQLRVTCPCHIIHGVQVRLWFLFSCGLAAAVC